MPRLAPPGSSSRTPAKVSSPAHVEREVREAQRPAQLDAVLALDDAQILGAREALRDLEAPGDRLEAISAARLRPPNGSPRLSRSSGCATATSASRLVLSSDLPEVHPSRISRRTRPVSDASGSAAGSRGKREIAGGGEPAVQLIALCP